MKALNIFSILICTAVMAKAQYVPNYKRAADVYFQNKEYYAAADYYKKALQISPDSVGFVVPYGFEKRLGEDKKNSEDRKYLVFRLAESLRLYRDFPDAEKWYAIAKDFPEKEYALAPFWYAESLRANQKFEEAITAFTAFIEKYREQDEYMKQARQDRESCRFALREMRYPRLVLLSKLPKDVNLAGSNYASVQSNDAFYFTSSRPVPVSGKKYVLEGKNTNYKVAQKETPYVNSIYSITGDPLSEKHELKRISFDKNMQTAAPAISASGNTIYFTGWTGKGDEKNYAIYSASKTQDGWSEPQMLGMQVNIKGFNAMQPSVSTDGRYLIFSSDRPGGLGKFDLWYCPIRSDGTVGQAVNMGSVINTPADEEAAFYNSTTKKLLFSSNGRVGLGGFDFFESEGDMAEWSEPQNLGYPFNSSRDDLYFSPLNNAASEGYISSDRESACCLELFYLKKEYIHIKGTLIDCNTHEPLNGATITLSDSLHTEKQVIDASGEYHFKLTSRRPVTITAEKDNYFTKVVRYTTEQLTKSDTLLNPNLCLVAFKIDKPIVIEDIFYDYDSANLRDSSKLVLDGLVTLMNDNPAIEIELGAHTDSKGTEAYNLDLSQRRAQACVDYLVSKGISPARLTSKGYGESRPIAPNTLPNGKDNPEGRQKNRRTEFKVTKK
ncbi:OmpA family protein [Pedobacter sp. BS3]|uniref:OmpA family protein n=1 Tax=Pedobacter sp. BS3 TaxID=2567937 RepID=UPI0011EBF5F3|nr:OmpA family protein [Pedobacter sp. BS3]TZF82051.1 OmpA family protein [Pedobacter sp. BS3]